MNNYYYYFNIYGKIDFIYLFVVYQCVSNIVPFVKSHSINEWDLIALLLFFLAAI